MTASIRRLPVIAVCAALAACAIPPKPNLPPLRSEAPLAGLPVPEQGEWPSTQWWKRFGDPQLDQLLDQALTSAPTLAEAGKRFDTALRSVEIARASGGLAAQGNLQVQRQRLSENGLIPPRFLGFTWYNQGDLNAQFQYDLDFWGKTRSAIEAAVDQVRAAQAERSAATLTLTAAIADTYFGWQADQARLALTRQSLQALERSRALSVKRVAHGIDLPDVLHQTDVQLASLRELAAAYAGSAQMRQAALAALLGLAPEALPKLQVKPLPAVDGGVPAHAGLDLIARRPDIAAHRWRVEAAMRQVEHVRAQFYPDISIGAMIGLQSLDLDKLLQAGSRMGGIGPAIHLPLFERGQLKAAYGVSQAQLDAAAAQYDSSVVDAARDVATQALNLQQIQARRSERDAQLAAAQALQRSVTARTQQGLGDDRGLLASQVSVEQQQDAATALHAQALSAQIALIKALGGGYRSDAAASSSPSPDRAESP